MSCSPGVDEVFEVLGVLGVSGAVAAPRQCLPSSVLGFVDLWPV
jgi:hypothetical protein